MTDEHRKDYLTDLTRWNRAGLRRFRYVGANAPRLLEDLRCRLEHEFPNWQQLAADTSEDDDIAKRLERLEALYTGPRGDLGWEIARAFARACHVLTEHIDAYANENYIRTATQWENVRRLAEMLDYSPAPPASASTPLVFMAKEGQNGTVEKGFQIKHAPPDGAPPIVFETLADLQIHSSLNEIRLDGWNRSTRPLNPPPEQVPDDDGNDDKPTPWQIPDDAEINEGESAILITERDSATAAAMRVAAVNTQERTLTICPATKNDTSEGELALDSNVNAEQPATASPAEADNEPTEGIATLRVKPKVVRTARLNGNNVVRFSHPHGLSVGDVVAWHGSGWHFARVAAEDTLRIRLSESPHTPGDSVEVFRCFTAHRGDPELTLPLHLRAAATLEASAFTDLDFSNDTEEVRDDDDIPRYRRIKRETINRVSYVLSSAEPTGTVTHDDAAGYSFDGNPAGLAIGQWVLAEDESRNHHAQKIATLEKYEDHFEVTFEVNSGESLHEPLLQLYWAFEHELRPVGGDRNDDPAPTADLRLAVDDAALPLLPGRKIVVEQENPTRDGFRNAFLATVLSVDEAIPSIRIDPPIPANRGFTIGNTVIRGNVVTAGHGETRPAKVLGSGDAALAGQTFLLEVAEVSFVADPSQPSGVRADLELNVNGQTWQQVATLNDSEPGDPHYTVRVTEDGHLRIQTGDGRHGRRLPTGTDNLQVAFRVGVGLTGNLAAESLTKPVRPHPAVASVRQPIVAAGGNEVEDVASLRTSVPASVMTLNRAVSVADFANLAGRHSSVWEASASLSATRAGHKPRIEVVVVPAGGGPLGNVARALRDTLLAHAIPTVDVVIHPFRPEPFDVEITVRVRSDEYEPDTVVADVRAAVRDAFTLQRRCLGQDLFVSELVRVVEGVAGVENCVCVINGDTGLGRVEACPRCVVFLDPARSRLDVLAKEFRL